MAAVKRVFKVNGKPFFPLGSESVTFGHYNIPEGTQEFVFKAVKQMHGNCITIPISWDEIEPEEGNLISRPLILCLRTDGNMASK